MTDGTKKVLSYLQNEGVGARFSTKELVTALGFSNNGYILAAIRTLKARGWVKRIAETTVDEKGEEKELIYFSITEEGIKGNPED